MSFGFRIEFKIFQFEFSCNYSAKYEQWGLKCTALFDRQLLWIIVNSMSLNVSIFSYYLLNNQLFKINHTKNVSHGFNIVLTFLYLSFLVTVLLSMSNEAWSAIARSVWPTAILGATNFVYIICMYCMGKQWNIPDKIFYFLVVHKYFSELLINYELIKKSV